MKDKLSKNEWLSKALEAINQEGFGRIKIDHLVASLGVTK
ncbi:MAG: AcrR family transcriptional regulator [Desulforhopalus sp.]|jgi:AcrR family transcriptional regulator